MIGGRHANCRSGGSAVARLATAAANITFSVAQRKNSELGKPLEDAFCICTDHNVVCVADGITRCRDAAGRYPERSLGRIAAQTAVRAIATSLCNATPLRRRQAEQDLRAAFEAANNCIAEYANEMPEHDFFYNDLPGTTATSAIFDQNYLYYAHVADSGLLQWHRNGFIARLTRNQTYEAEVWLRRANLDRHTRLLISRRDFRNRIDSQYHYGALTGESAALALVEYGSTHLSPGDCLVFYTDGLGSWIERCLTDHRFAQRSYRHMQTGNLEHLLDDAEYEEERRRSSADDKTVILVWLG
jgi:serine/threonine protein phosphatase PrpC